MEMDFERTRGANAKERCKNIHETWGSPLCCDCGCQTPRDGDQPDSDSLTGLTAKWVKSFQWEIALYRGDARVGQIAPGQNYIFIDGNEYLGVKKDSQLGYLLSLPVSGKREASMTYGSTLEETAAQVAMSEKIELMEMDERNKNHPEYCTKCHGFCYGDCEAS